MSKIEALESKLENIVREEREANQRMWCFLGDQVKDIQAVQTVVGSATFEGLFIPSLSSLGRQVAALAQWRQETVQGKAQEIQAVVENIVMKISELVAPIVDSCIAATLPAAVSGAIEVVGEKLVQEVHLKLAVKEEDTRRHVLEKVMNAIDLKLAAKGVAVGSGCSEKERSVSGVCLD